MKTVREKTIELLTYIESKNSHGRTQLATTMSELGLQNSELYRYIETEAPTNIGKNQLKDKMLQLIIAKMK